MQIIVLSIKFILRHKVVALLLTCTTLVVYAVSTFTILVIESQAKPDSLVIASSNHPEQRSKLRSGWNLTRAGDQVIYANGENNGVAWQTTTKIASRLFTVNKKEVRIYKQQKIAKALKLSMSDQRCVFGSTPQLKKGVGNLYNCSSGTEIVTQLSTLPAKSTLLAKLDQVSATPYLGGILVVEKSDKSGGRVVSFINESRKTEIYRFTTRRPVTSSEDFVQGKQEPFVQTSVNKNEGSFIIADPLVGRLLYFKNLTEKNPITLDFDALKNKQENEIAITSGNIYVYTGKEVTGFGIGESSITKKSSYQLPEKHLFLRLYVIDANHFSFGLIGGAADIFKTEGPTLKIIETLGQRSSGSKQDPTDIEHSHTDGRDIADILVFNKVIYYIDGNSLYAYSPETQSSWLVHYSESVTFKSLQRTGTDLMISGNPQNTPSSRYTYVLTTVEKKVDNVSEKLPYSPKRLPVVTMDFTDTQIVVIVRLDSLQRNGVGNKDTYDDKEFETKKAIITQQLKNDGITTQNYKIIIKPSFTSF